MHTRFWLLLTLINLSVYAAGQDRDQYENYAMAAFHSRNYSSALFYSQKVIRQDSANITTLFIAGEAARYLGKYELSEMYLEKIPDRTKIGYFSATDYELAMVKINLRKYDEAIALLKNYIEVNGAPDDLLTKYAEDELRGLEQMNEAAKAAFRYQASLLPENINSDLDDFSPMRHGDKIYFSRAYKAEGKALPVSRIFEAIQNYPARLAVINPKDNALNASNIALTPDGRRIYYTLCSDQNYRQQKQCAIWYREREYEGTWAPPVKLPAHINVRNYTSTQPSVGWDRDLKKFILYFSSDRADGKGGMDIWATTIERDGTFGDPFPMPFNTPGDEVTPFFHQTSQTLFFSSDGWPTIGGLDVFRSMKKDGSWSDPENLGDLINSRYNDYYYCFHGGSGNAYFTSDRPGETSQRSAQRRDDDLYVARIFVDVKLQAFDQDKPDNLLTGLSVVVEELSNNSSGSLNALPDETQIVARLETGQRYRVTLLAEGYEPESIEVNTKGYSYIAELKKTLYLKSKIKP